MLTISRLDARRTSDLEMICFNIHNNTAIMPWGRVVNETDVFVGDSNWMISVLPEISSLGNTRTWSRRDYCYIWYCRMAVQSPRKCTTILLLFIYTCLEYYPFGLVSGAEYWGVVPLFAWESQEALHKSKTEEQESNSWTSATPL
jgi:hypothetical protein